LAVRSIWPAQGASGRRGGGFAQEIRRSISSTLDVDLLTGMTRQSGVPVQVRRVARLGSKTGEPD
jgi:hypothetical protein